MAQAINLLDLLSAFAVSEGEFVPGSVPARDNNPGDLNYAGQLGAKPDGRFASFSCLEEGICANLRQLCADAQRGWSLRQICNSWAPRADGNDSDLYLREAVRRVAAISGIVIDPDTPLWNYLPIRYIP